MIAGLELAKASYPLFRQRGPLCATSRLRDSMATSFLHTLQEMQGLPVLCSRATSSSSTTNSQASRKCRARKNRERQRTWHHDMVARPCEASCFSADCSHCCHSYEAEEDGFNRRTLQLSRPFESLMILALRISLQLLMVLGVLEGLTAAHND